MTDQSLSSSPASSDAGSPPALNPPLEAIPPVFTIETVLGCNLHCPACAIGGGMVMRKHGRLTFERYQIVAEKIRPYCRYFYLHLWGEPLLNIEIYDIIRHASQYSQTNISTNAVTLNDEKAEKLITSGVTDVIVSIDGMSQDVYERYRAGGKVDRALSGLMMLQKYNLAHGTPVAIMPQYILFKHNQHEAAQFAQFCADIGLRATFKAPYLRKTEGLEYSDIPGFRRQHHENQADRLEAMKTCQNGWNVFTIHLDGSVVACCYDHNRETYFGNIFEQSVEEIWNSPAYTRFRYRLRTGHAERFCVDQCLLY
ncbi:radical SAM/SPASM domain-containing protein [Pararhodospirillum oryzae]|uniref:Radical SAM protein n=1 Tax=Pararhodospirillum oryzae TaxID=478448 RepID=A0A512H9P9_9PROT|nr:radical SAM protein [Pararhodospirillum oryzae]GEO82179.1 hypothetical protein ROR02_23100 [Pararhodospirillum oryzae]